MLICKKLKLLVIGKAKNPRAFKIGKKPVKLPPLIEYEGAPNAWMNEETFSNWLRRLDQKMRRQGRHILLLLDNWPQSKTLQTHKHKARFLSSQHHSNDPTTGCWHNLECESEVPWEGDDCAVHPNRCCSSGH